MVNIYKSHKKEILIQPPGEPREQHLGDVRQKKKLLEGSIYIGTFFRPTSSGF